MSKKKPTLICRPFERDEWEALRDLRLEALQDSPGSFSSIFEKEKKRPERHWRNTAHSDECTVFGLFIDDVPVGIIGITTMSADATGQTAVLWGTYIQPAYRGNGLTKPLYKTAIAYAKARTDWNRLVISHRDSNIASKKATLSHGFKYTISENKNWPDGTSEPESFYEMDLTKGR